MGVLTVARPAGKDDGGGWPDERGASPVSGGTGTPSDLPVEPAASTFQREHPGDDDIPF